MRWENAGLVAAAVEADAFEPGHQGVLPPDRCSGLSVDGAELSVVEETVCDGILELDVPRWIARCVAVALEEGDVDVYRTAFAMSASLATLVSRAWPQDQLPERGDLGHVGVVAEVRTVL